VKTEEEIRLTNIDRRLKYLTNNIHLVVLSLNKIEEKLGVK